MAMSAAALAWRGGNSEARQLCPGLFRSTTVRASSVALVWRVGRRGNILPRQQRQRHVLGGLWPTYGYGLWPMAYGLCACELAVSLSRFSLNKWGQKSAFLQEITPDYSGYEWIIAAARVPE